MHSSRKRKTQAKKKPVPDLIRRQRALFATMEHFAGQELRLGRADCIKLLRFHLIKMGHRRLPKAEGYSNLIEARRVLKQLGFKNLEELLDSLLERIAPAFMLPGDVGLVEAERGAPAWQVGTVVIAIGTKFIGWHPDHPQLAIIEPNFVAPFLAAWRA